MKRVGFWGLRKLQPGQVVAYKIGAGSDRVEALATVISAGLINARVVTNYSHLLRVGSAVWKEHFDNPIRAVPGWRLYVLQMVGSTDPGASEQAAQFLADHKAFRNNGVPRNPFEGCDKERFSGWECCSTHRWLLKEDTALLWRAHEFVVNVKGPVRSANWWRAFAKEFGLVLPNTEPYYV